MPIHDGTNRHAIDVGAGEPAVEDEVVSEVDEASSSLSP